MEQVWQRLGVSAYNPVRQFQIVYCTWLAIAMLCNMRNHCRFYRWFSSSRCCRTMARACMLRTTRVLPRTTRPSRHVVFTARSIPLASKRGLGAHPSKIYGAAAPALTLTLSLTRTLPDPWHSCSGSNPDPRLNPSLNPDRELLQVSSRLRR